MNLSIEHIKIACDYKSYQRGEVYFKQNRVFNFISEEGFSDAVFLQADVRGQSLYLVDVTLGAENDIIGNCSCPVSYNCKHVVAVCLQYFYSQNTLIGTKTDNSLLWLNNFVSASIESEVDDRANLDFITYVVRPSSHAPATLTVALMMSRYLKKGGLNKGRRAYLHNITGMYGESACAQDVDRDIAGLIEAQNDAIWGGYNRYNLAGELGFITINKMVETGRCIWEFNQGKVLSLGGPREIGFTWFEEANGDCRLNLKLQPEAMALMTTPPMYVDPEVGEVGVIDGVDFNAKQWRLLLEAPIVPADYAKQFSQTLLSSLPEVNLPTPKKYETISIASQSFVPHLTLQGQFNAASEHRVHSMRLQFSYAGYELDPLNTSATSRLCVDNQIIIIERDLEAERKAVETMLIEGFEAEKSKEKGFVLSAPEEESLMASASLWQCFLQERLPELEAQGWLVSVDDSFHLKFLEVDEWDVAVESENDWFDLRFDLDIQGRKVPLLPLIAEVLQHFDLKDLPENLSLPLGDSEYLQVPGERILPVCQVLYELYDSPVLDSNGAMRLNRFDVGRLAELETSCFDEMHWRGGKAMRALGKKLKDFSGIKKVALPRGFKATLRDYQKQGLNWLQFLREFEFNGILADDMGLGKTVQTLAHLLVEKNKKRLTDPCLIIAPTSLMSNWRREAEQFTPKLSVLVLQGAERKKYFDNIDQYDLVLTTYPLLVRDKEVLLAQHYHYLILDEAQVIKNPRAKAARLARDISARHRLCLTGTPMENHLGELWALFDFLMPGFLGDSKTFTKQFRNPIEKNADAEKRQRLVRRVTPFMLRRSKSEVVTELPEKTIITRSVALDGKQAALYESIRLSMEKKVREAIAQKGLARSHITILDALLKLRQTCCDPRLLSLPQAKKVTASAKLDMLMEMIPELLEEGRRILLFSQFTKMLTIIEQQFKEKGISYTKLTGQTRQRDKVIERFRQGEVSVFLISLKAGGVGLNLTEADTVIHYDPWWNPAVENQATDRTHRIGQKKAVFVYKLITENTLEEKILAMQERKQALADGVYKSSAESKDLKLDADDLQALFAPMS